MALRFSFADMLARTIDQVERRKQMEYQRDVTERQLANEDRRFNLAERQFDWSKESFGQSMDFEKEKFGYGKERDTVRDDQWDKTFREGRRQFDLAHGLAERKFGLTAHEYGKYTEPMNALSLADKAQQARTEEYIRNLPKTMGLIMGSGDLDLDILREEMTGPNAYAFLTNPFVRERLGGAFKAEKERVRKGMPPNLYDELMGALKGVSDAPGVMENVSSGVFGRQPTTFLGQPLSRPRSWNKPEYQTPLARRARELYILEQLFGSGPAIDIGESLNQLNQLGYTTKGLVGPTQ